MQTVLCVQKGSLGPRRSADTGDENEVARLRLRLLARDGMRCFAKKVLPSIAPNTFISPTKMLIVSRIGPRIVFLNATRVRSCSKLSREITTEH